MAETSETIELAWTDRNDSYRLQSYRLYEHKAVQASSETY